MPWLGDTSHAALRLDGAFCLRREVRAAMLALPELGSPWCLWDTPEVRVRLERARALFDACLAHADMQPDPPSRKALDTAEAEYLRTLLVAANRRHDARSHGYLSELVRSLEPADTTDTPSREPPPNRHQFEHGAPLARFDEHDTTLGWRWRALGHATHTPEQRMRARDAINRVERHVTPAEREQLRCLRAELEHVIAHDQVSLDDILSGATPTPSSRPPGRLAPAAQPDARDGPRRGPDTYEPLVDGTARSTTLRSRVRQRAGRRARLVA